MIRVEGYPGPAPAVFQFEPLGGIPGWLWEIFSPLIHVVQGMVFRDLMDLRSESNCIAMGIISSPSIASSCHWIKPWSKQS